MDVGRGVATKRSKPAARTQAPAGLLDSARLPAGLLLVTLAASVALAFGAARLSTDAGLGLLVDTGSAGYRDQAAFAAAFGGDPVVIEIEAQPGQTLLTPQHMVGMAGMEGKLAAVHGVKRVYGP